MSEAPTPFVLPSGKTIWMANGLVHRLDGPAVIWPDGVREWYRKNLRHNENGPSIIRRDGSRAWHLDGQPIPIVLTVVDGIKMIFTQAPFVWVYYPSRRNGEFMFSHVLDEVDLTLFMLSHVVVEMPYG